MNTNNQEERKQNTTQQFSYPLIGNIPSRQVQVVPVVSQPVQQRIVAPQAPNQQIVKLQCQVKKNAKILRFISNVLVFAAVFTIVVNFLALFVVDQFTYFNYYDSEGKHSSFEFDPSGIYFASFIKIFCSIVILKQGKRILETVKPVLQQYKDAEQGLTQGVLMTQRKSKQTKAASMFVQRVTAIIIITVLIASAYLDTWMSDETSIFINQYYFKKDQYSEKMMRQSNITDSLIQYSDENKMSRDVTFQNKSEDIQPIEHQIENHSDLSPPVYEVEQHDHESHHKDVSKFQPHDHSMHHGNHNFKEFNQTIPKHNDHKFTKEPSYEFETGRCPSDPYMQPQDYVDWMSKVDKYFAEYCLDSGIDAMFIFSFIFFAITFVCFQKYIQIVCARMAKNQKILEDKYMGPEMIQAPAQARAQAQPVIQYIAVPQHFAQQYPSHVTNAAQMPQVFSSSINSQNTMI